VKPEFRDRRERRVYRRLTTTSNDLWAALVDEPMAQLHERAMPIGKFFASA
jgi:hypothetical protein